MNYDFVNTQLVIKDGKLPAKDSSSQDESDAARRRISSSSNENVSRTNLSTSSVRQQDLEENQLQADLNKKFKTFTIEEYSNTDRTVCQVIRNYFEQKK